MEPEARTRALRAINKVDARSKHVEDQPNPSATAIRDMALELRSVAHNELAWVVRHCTIDSTDHRTDVATVYATVLASLEAACGAWLDRIEELIPEIRAGFKGPDPALLAAQALMAFAVTDLAHLRAALLADGPTN